jgi:serine protease Do
MLARSVHSTRIPAAVQQLMILRRGPGAFRLATVLLIGIVIAQSAGSAAFGQKPTNRRTPLVDAVALVRPSVVNLRGRKTLALDPAETASAAQPARQVNGMGTGVIIDPAGYILTNFHVVEDVRRIEVTLEDGTTTTGSLIAHDGDTDLALIKIQINRPLPVIPLGTSSDVMLAETVAALGNAYGYEDTVTRGIVSEIGRTVQVSDTQIYNNLLQTDAPINPGNSGGPLINLDGEMIGINVAVRVGAQGIAFAIPVNDAMEVAAGFFREINSRQISHGLTVSTGYNEHIPETRIDSIDASLLDSGVNVQVGDIVVSIDGVDCPRAVDFERALINSKPGDRKELVLSRNGTRLPVSLTMKDAGDNEGHDIWRRMGIQVSQVPVQHVKSAAATYEKGLRVDRVRPGSSAAREGIREGDILVAMHGWRTESMDNLIYILSLPDVSGGKDVVFYIVRNQEPFFGNIRAAAQTSVTASR